jgi:hypothetical protein
MYSNLGIENLGVEIKKCGIVTNPRELKPGDIVNYKGIFYFFRPNGSVAFLYKTISDYKRIRKNRRCIRREKLKGAPLYAILSTEDSIVDILKTESDESESEETYEDIIKTRRIVLHLNEEELQKMFERMRSTEHFSEEENLKYEQ